MTNATSTTASPLTMHWVAVTDDRGRTRMEARWGTSDHAVVHDRHAA